MSIRERLDYRTVGHDHPGKAGAGDSLKERKLDSFLIVGVSELPLFSLHLAAHAASTTGECAAIRHGLWRRIARAAAAAVGDRSVTGKCRFDLRITGLRLGYLS